MLDTLLSPAVSLIPPLALFFVAFFICSMFFFKKIFKLLIFVLFLVFNNFKSFKYFIYILRINNWFY